MTESEIKATIKTIDASIKKHRELAMWGNVESKERLRSLRARKRDLKQKLEILKFMKEG